MPVCKQCGLSIQNVKSDKTVTKNNALRTKCDMCLDLNNMLTSYYSQKYFDREDLNKACLNMLETYKFLVDTYHKGNLLDAQIPFRAKEVLINRGHYPEYAYRINMLINEKLIGKTEERLNKYKDAYHK